MSQLCVLWKMRKDFTSKQKKDHPWLKTQKKAHHLIKEAGNTKARAYNVPTRINFNSPSKQAEYTINKCKVYLKMVTLFQSVLIEEEFVLVENDLDEQLGRQIVVDEYMGRSHGEGDNFQNRS